jgi:hypothetical protein
MKKIILLIFRAVGSIFLSIALVRALIPYLNYEGEPLTSLIIKVVFLLVFLLYYLNKDLINL